MLYKLSSPKNPKISLIYTIIIFLRKNVFRVWKYYYAVIYSVLTKFFVVGKTCVSTPGMILNDPIYLKLMVWYFKSDVMSR